MLRLLPPHACTSHPSPIAVALFDYEALGEDGNLTFDEGDLLEVST